MGNESHHLCLRGSQKLCIYLLSNYGDKFRMSKKAENQFKMSYDIELDTNPGLSMDVVSSYLIIIGILKWIITIGRINMIAETLLCLSHARLPR